MPALTRSPVAFTPILSAAPWERREPAPGVRCYNPAPVWAFGAAFVPGGEKVQRVWRARALPRFGWGFQELRAESLHDLARLFAGIPRKRRYKKKDRNLNSLRRRQRFQSSCQGLLPGRVGQSRHSAAHIPGGDRAGSCWGGSPTHVPTPHALHPMELPAGVTLAVGGRRERCRRGAGWL